MNTVERIKSICKERKIAISRLEKECGFSNGYIGQLKKGTVPDDRLRLIAEFLGLSTEYLMTGKEPSVDYVYNEEWAEFLAELVKSDDPERIKRIMSYYRCLDESQKDIMETFLKTLSENVNEK